MILTRGFYEGQAHDGEGRNVEFTAKEEPAVLPRVEQVYIISALSPWCTTVKNPQGVTMSDVCQAIWQELVFCLCRSLLLSAHPWS